ncbi:hypothetical protein NDU88_004233 [Pleurodeles waltl]|uniref:Uncharacterized protein n=1 Tax=Pleurodeles waltl TaxID=8319 RepID=A0AAV7PFF5_PLEWA|nr:hypothetical protein NDU88_004233 [Pleurodeles waltl]
MWLAPADNSTRHPWGTTYEEGEEPGEEKDAAEAAGIPTGPEADTAAWLPGGPQWTIGALIQRAWNPAEYALQQQSLNKWCTTTTSGREDSCQLRSARQRLQRTEVEHTLSHHDFRKRMAMQHAQGDCADKLLAWLLREVHRSAPVMVIRLADGKVAT